jgi:hypothetical protein
MAVCWTQEREQISRRSRTGPGGDVCMKCWIDYSEHPMHTEHTMCLEILSGEYRRRYPLRKSQDSC